MTARQRRAGVVGLGLIGGSLALALRERGWAVTGTDRDPGREAEALRRGVVDATGTDPEAEITFLAVPVGALAEAARDALAAGPGLVTDVGSVKAPVCEAVPDRRFVGGHPMAGSEQEGLEGADPSLFQGAVWVLCPTTATDDGALSTIASVVGSLGAEVVALPPDRHDELVATVSHVPHLTAVSLMALAETRSVEHAALLRLAAGGFRDMTRVASGHPGIWPDICAENRVAIVETLDALRDTLSQVRDLVDKGDREALVALLRRARAARSNLPGRVTEPSAVAEVRVPIRDRVGVLSEVTTLAAELGVNVANFEVVHSTAGGGGVAVLLVDAALVERLRGGLVARGYRPSVSPLEVDR